MIRPLTVTALPGIGEIGADTDLAPVVLRAIDAAGIALDAHSVIVIAQKIVSKSERRRVCLDDVEPSSRALDLAAITGKSPALVELILRESSEVVRARPQVLIVRHRLGYVVANAGIDKSNVAAADGRVYCLLLPEDPNASASRLRSGIAVLGRPAPAVIVSDSFGRPWRRGVVNVAIGSAGLPALVDRRGHLDRAGRPLRVTEVAFADALAAAAGVVMGEANEGNPVAHIAGACWSAPENDAGNLVRPLAEDLFQ